MSPATVTSITPRTSPAVDRPAARQPRRPFRDNPKLILAGIVVIIGFYFTNSSDQFEGIYNNIKPENAGTLHGRTEIWSFAASLRSM